jgi:integrase/recombinase XerD
LNPRPPPCEPREKIDKEQIEEYFNIIKLQGFCDRHNNESARVLNHYLNHVDYKIDKHKSLKYFKTLLDNHSISYYKKQVYQILKFLRYLKIGWANDIKLPPDPYYLPKRVSKEHIKLTLHYFKKHTHYIQAKAIIMLGFTSGLRAEELYSLTSNDIDIEDRKVYIRHNPKNNHTTKTKKDRISFFTPQAQEAITDYLTYFKNSVRLRTLFAKKTLERKFTNAPLHVKDLRKAFSQEWDRCGGPTSIKKILMGHSLRNDVDLMHYNAQSPEDLKQIYDKVMNSNLLNE